MVCNINGITCGKDCFVDGEVGTGRTTTANKIKSQLQSPQHNRFRSKNIKKPVPEISCSLTVSHSTLESPNDVNANGSAKTADTCSPVFDNSNKPGQD